MNIDGIFEIVQGALASVKFSDEPYDAFQYRFELWEDIEYLFGFFELNREDLNSDYWNLSIDQAIQQVLEEATQLRYDIIRYAEKGQHSSTEKLDDIIFVPLDKSDYKNVRVPSKAYGQPGINSLVRIYAIRLGPNQYIVTGGAIKLTPKMDRDHLQIELRKLQLVSAYLKSHGIDSVEDYGFIEFTKPEDK